MALDASARLVSLEGERDVSLDRFFEGSGEAVVRPGEVIKSVLIPRFVPGAKNGAEVRVCDAYKVSLRRNLSPATVAGSFAVELDGRGFVTDAWLAYSGIGDRPLRARLAEKNLSGREWSEESIHSTLPTLNSEIEVTGEGPDDPHYRKQLVITLLQKFFYQHSSAGRAEDASKARELGAVGAFLQPDRALEELVSVGEAGGSGEISEEE